MRTAAVLLIPAIVGMLAGCVPQAEVPAASPDRLAVASSHRPTPPVIDAGPTVDELQQQFFESAVETVVEEHGADVCGVLREHPDASVSDMIDAVVAEYGIPGYPYEQQWELIRRTFLDATDQQCPDQSERVLAEVG